MDNLCKLGRGRREGGWTIFVSWEEGGGREGGQAL